MLEKRFERIGSKFDSLRCWKKDLKKNESEFDNHRIDARLKLCAVECGAKGYAARESSMDEEGRNRKVYCL